MRMLGLTAQLEQLVSREQGALGVNGRGKCLAANASKRGCWLSHPDDSEL